MRPFFSVLESRRPPRLPEGVRVYAVGDVHGRADLLAQLLAQIDSHLAHHPVSRPIEVFLGDYVDRGPNSRDVIDLLISRRNSRETIFLKGNHEKYVLDFLRDPKIWDHWCQYGGFETLLSYGLRPQLNSSPADREELARTFADALPHEHLLFLSCLTTSFTCGDFFFVHAGVKPGIALDQQAEKNLLWIRDDFLLSEDDFGKYIVHGHTPVREADIRSNRANIDTGAFVTGCLTCLAIEGGDMQVIAQSSNGAGKIADESRTKALVAGAHDAPVILDLAESTPTVAPAHATEAIDDAGGRQPSSAAAGHTFEASSVVEGRLQPPHAIQQPCDERSPTVRSDRRRSRTLRIVVGSIAAMLLLTVAPLLLPILVPHWHVSVNIGDAGSRIFGSGVTAPAPIPAPAERAGRSARLTFVQSADRSASHYTPLGLRVSGDTAGMAVMIGGLPTGMTLSSGRSVGSGVWRIPATEVADAMIDAPQGIVGTTDLAIELRLADNTVVDQGSLHLRWPTSPIAAARTEATEGELARSSTVTTKTAAPTTPTDQSAARIAPAPQLDRAHLDLLMRRSEKLISEGDVVAARVPLRRAAEARDSRAAFTLGSTYDPIMLRILKVRGVPADISLARRWYEKARELGSAEAQRRLDILSALVREPTLPDRIDRRRWALTSTPRPHAIPEPQRLRLRSERARMHRAVQDHRYLRRTQEALVIVTRAPARVASSKGTKATASTLSSPAKASACVSDGFGVYCGPTF